MIQKTLDEIARIVDGEVAGDGKILITGISGIKEAKEGDLTFIANSKYIPLLEKTKASAVLASREIRTKQKPLIYTDNPSLAFAKMASFVIGQQQHHLKGIHATALIGEGVQLGKEVTIGPYAVIEDNVRIGDRTIIYSGCFIGHDTKIGSHCLIYPNVSIRERITVGNRVIVHSGTAIGADGFGFTNVAGVHQKIPQIGTVVIEDDVEIGANVTIDRARFDTTFIGRGTKIDNLVQIAHNVHIGENCIIVAQAGISGSTTIEKDVILAGQAGIVGHVTIGEGSIVTAQSGVSKSIPPHTQVFGSPAKPHQEAKRVHAAVQRLPGYVKMIVDLKKRVEQLEEKIASLKKKS